MTMTLSPYDLLKEKRQELGIDDPSVSEASIRRSLIKGIAIGAGLVGLTLGVSGLLFVRSSLVNMELEKLATVEAEAEQLQARLASEKTKLKAIDSINSNLVRGLLLVRSGSALMRDLQLRIPEGIQLTDAKEQGSSLVLKGLAQDPKAFAKINALQLQLKRSPLMDASQEVRLVKASRAAKAPKDGFVPPVSFELRAAFRKEIPPAAEKLILEQLGSEGLARRFALLQQEGLLR